MSAAYLKRQLAQDAMQIYRVAHASRVLALVSRRNGLFFNSFLPFIDNWI
jgi:hypothetical protein